MKLIKFRVRDFRSVEDSGWVDADNVTALIGTNESGKTNLLLPLWKLKPAKDGAINPTADFPRKRFNEIRNMPDDKKPVFIETHFELSDALAQEVAAIAGADVSEVRVASVSRTLGGNYRVGFPDAPAYRYSSEAAVLKIIQDAQKEIGDIEVSKTEESLKDSMLRSLVQATTEAKKDTKSKLRTVSEVKSVVSVLAKVDTESALKRSIINPRFGQVIDDLNEIVAITSKPTPSNSQEARSLVLKNVPSFVYYSNYGNLDSEIYLPHVIQNMERENLGSREEAKARTLKVLFEFVRLKPEEIRELGQDLPNSGVNSTEAQIKATAEKKKERDILLQSAGTVSLTPTVCQLKRERIVVYKPRRRAASSRGWSGAAWCCSPLSTPR